MPRKRKPRFAEHKVAVIDPGDRNAVEDRDLVRHALVDFDEVTVLSDEIRERLVEDLVDSIRFARGGVNAGKRHVSNKALARHVFLADVARALARAGLPVKRWRRDDRESLLYGVAHALADTSNLHLPQDLKPPALRATRIQHGATSPVMQRAQDAELAARRRRFDRLVIRLKAAGPMKQGRSVDP
jgi:hypothetical protein